MLARLADPLRVRCGLGLVHLSVFFYCPPVP